MEKEFYKIYSEAEKKHWWFQVRRKMIFYLVKKYSQAKNPKILDFGCGSGILVKKLQDDGYQALGVDVSKESISYGISQNIKNLSRFEGDRLEFDDKIFDFILALDVLEHIKDEKLILTEFARVLADNGTIIITVPAYMFLWGIQDEVSHHFRRYNLNQLTDLVNKTNFKIIRETYFNTFLFPLIAPIRIISRWFNLKNRRSDFSLNSKLLNRLLYSVFYFESILLKRFDFPFGVSILLVLKKR